MNMEEQREEQPKEEKPIGYCQEPLENVNTTGAKLASSHRHRKLPAELNCEIFYCLHLATRRKFICRLGWDFYAMFRQILLKNSKRLRNPKRNEWSWSKSTAGITISNGGLNVSKNTNGLQKVYAVNGFPVSVQHSREDNFPGTILYYYEVKILKSAYWCLVGLTDGEIPSGSGGFIRWPPNSYYIVSPIPNLNHYQIFLAGKWHLIEIPPEGVNRPKLKDAGNAIGCGILMNPDDKVTIFFTLNGILIDRQVPISPTVDHLVPTVTLWDGKSVEANFGVNPAKPFEYDIKKCPGMGLECI